MARTRSFDDQVQVDGVVHKNIHVGGLPSHFTRLTGAWGNVTDVVGERDQDNPFDLNYWHRDILIANGEYYGYSGLVHQVTNYGITGTTVAIPNATGRAPIVDYAELAWRARQFTDPQRPMMSLPQFIGEAGDLPSLLKSIPELLMLRGRAVAKRFGRKTRPRPKNLAPDAKPSSVMAVANSITAPSRRVLADTGSQYIAGQFGWAPTVRDLAAMLALAQALKQYLAMLLDLLHGRTIKRRMKLPNLFDVVVTPNRYLETFAFIAKGEYVDHWRTDHWVTARWGATPLFTAGVLPDCDDPDDIIGLAYRLMTGMNKNGWYEAWWELLPWSWMMDWWFNIGRLWAALIPGALYLQLESLCYCRTCKFTRNFVVTQHPYWITFSGGGKLVHKHKYRKDIRPYLSMDYMRGPPLVFPDLKPGQWAILAGLLAQKLV